MYKARNYINKKALLGLYHTYIYPHFIYCIESWGNASNCHLDPLFVIQRRILRILSFSSYDVPSESLFKHTNILSLYKLVHYRIGIMMYKYANYLLPSVMNDLYTVNSDIIGYNLVSVSLLYNVPTHKIDRLQRLQNQCARILTKSPRREHITPVLKSLHWLKIQDRITYKILMLTYKSYYNIAPTYSSSFVSSNRILPFVYTFSGIFVELLKVIQSAGMC